MPEVIMVAANDMALKKRKKRKRVYMQFRGKRWLLFSKVHS